MAKRKVLIVEDDVDFASTLTMALEIKNHSATVVHNGMAAIKLVEEQAFDVCFLDIKMPGMSGIECLEKIKKVLPVDTFFVMMTGFRDSETLDMARLAGARCVLLKPFKMAEFVRCAEELTCH